MIASAAVLLGSPETWSEIGTTLRCVALAALSAIVLGFLAGLALSRLRRIRPFINFAMSVYYAVPLFVFYPVLLVIFGLGEMPIIGIAFLYAAAAMIVGTLDAADRIPPVFGKVSRVMQVGPIDNLLSISLPAAAPHLMAGVRVAVGYAFVGVIASEFVVSSSGLGHSVAMAYEAFQNRDMYGLLLILVVLVLMANRGLSLLQRFVSRNPELVR
jgi:NitT/TauT family transport system permease protein